MQASQSRTEVRVGDGCLLLSVDTCGPSGSVALGRLTGEDVEILGQTELAGRSYSATLVAAVGELLAGNDTKLKDIGAIVAVNGPGSFTGVRVGLSAVKGLAEPGGIPVVVVSRLAALAWKAGCFASALDAHRHEVFLRVDGERELLAGASELADVDPPPARIAVCDEAAAALLVAAWPNTELVRTEAPTAADALRMSIPRVVGADFVDLALMDGHYLRRSDAEIFGETVVTASKPKAESLRAPLVRRMAEADLDRAVEIAQNLKHAPAWPRAAYVAAVDPAAEPKRIALVAEDAATGDIAGFAVASLAPPEAELETIAVAAAFQRRGIGRLLFSTLARELRQETATEVFLEVRGSNHAALALYGSLGFVEAGRRPRYYADPVEDAVLMRLRLS